MNIWIKVISKAQFYLQGICCKAGFCCPPLIHASLSAVQHRVEDICRTGSTTNSKVVSDCTTSAERQLISYTAHPLWFIHIYIYIHRLWSAARFCSVQRSPTVTSPHSLASKWPCASLKYSSFWSRQCCCSLCELGPAAFSWPIVEIIILQGGLAHSSFCAVPLLDIYIHCMWNFVVPVVCFTGKELKQKQTKN